MYEENLNFDNVFNVVKKIVQIETWNIQYVTYLLPKIEQFQ